jgi:hypothetical protein
MGCVSVSYTPENQINLFFKTLSIKSTTPKMYYKILKETFNECTQSNKTISSFHSLLMQRIFFNPSFEKEGKHLFSTYFSSFCLYPNKQLKGNEELNLQYALFLIAMVFLCKPNKEEAYETVCNLIKDWKISLIGDMIDKEILVKMLKIYFSCISSLCIHSLKSIYDHPDYFVDTMKDRFKESIQELYLQNTLLSHLKAKQIRLYKFYSKDYYEQYLTYDDYLREKFICLSMDDDYRLKNKEEKRNFTEESGSESVSKTV